MQFLAPETNQQVTIEASVDGNEDGLFIDEILNGANASIVAGYVGGPDNLGFNTITITATDNGSPEAATELVIVVDVIDVELPVLTISGNTTICAGASTVLEASEGLTATSGAPGVPHRAVK